MRDSEVALFPLKTVLYPGGPLALRIFEPRYVDMVKRCVSDNTGFGVVAIERGQEAGPATTHEIGTLARIVDWYSESDGLLGIVVIGAQRFRILDSRVQEDGLRVGHVEMLPDEEKQPVPQQFRYMAELLESIVDQLGEQYALIDKDFHNASWLGYRFAEILPVELADRQQYLESDDALARLAGLAPILDALSVDEAR